MTQDVNQFVRQLAAPPKSKPKSLPFDPEHFGKNLAEFVHEAIDRHSEILIKEMTAVIKPRIEALEADNKSLVELVGELERKVDRLEKRA